MHIFPNGFLLNLLSGLVQVVSCGTRFASGRGCASGTSPSVWHDELAEAIKQKTSWRDIEDIIVVGDIYIIKLIVIPRFACLRSHHIGICVGETSCQTGQYFNFGGQ